MLSAAGSRKAGSPCRRSPRRPRPEQGLQLGRKAAALPPEQHPPSPPVRMRPPGGPRARGGKADGSGEHGTCQGLLQAVMPCTSTAAGVRCRSGRLPSPPQRRGMSRDPRAVATLRARWAAPPDHAVAAARGTGLAGATCPPATDPGPARTAQPLTQPYPTIEQPVRLDAAGRGGVVGHSTGATCGRRAEEGGPTTSCSCRRVRSRLRMDESAKATRRTSRTRCSIPRS